MAEAATAKSPAEYEQEIVGLKERIHDLENEDCDCDTNPPPTLGQIEALELYADPANWTDDRFTPVFKPLDPDPYGPARMALEVR